MTTTSLISETGAHPDHLAGLVPRGATLPSAPAADPDANPIASVRPLELERAPRLDSSLFPNPPRKPDQAPPSTIANVRHLLAAYGITARYNVIRKKLLVTLPGYSGSPDNYDNVALTQILSLATLNGMNTGPIPAIIEAIGDGNLFNPVADWIKSRPWDGRDRLGEVYATLHQRPDFPETLKKKLVHHWLLSAVAAVLKPAGFRSRGVLTLQGPQGIGKTAWTRSLVPDPALCQEVVKVDHYMDAHNKDSVVSAVSHWLVEIGELDGSFKRDVAKLKGFLTCDRDKVRRPYDKVDSEYQRRTVFCATVNDENFLVDSTGNTRFWTIPLVSIDYRHEIDMQQVFAQLAVEFENGEQWWLDPDEEEWLEEHNKDHRVVSAIRERLLELIDVSKKSTYGLPAMTAGEVLRDIQIEKPTNPQQKECGSILRELLGEPKKIKGLIKWRIPLRDNSEKGDTDYAI